MNEEKTRLMAEANEQPILIYTTLPSPEEAKRIGGVLVGERLAACVNIFPGMVSIYEWKGAVEQAAEAAMMIKTRRNLEAAVFERVRALHPYELPALLTIGVTGGSEAYCGWILDQTAETGGGNKGLTHEP